MAVKCVNHYCTATRHDDEGKMFRLDLDLGSKNGGSERMTEYIWLCADCAQRMHPRSKSARTRLRFGFPKTFRRCRPTPAPHIYGRG